MWSVLLLLMNNTSGLGRATAQIVLINWHSGGDQYKTEHGLPANNITSVSSDGNSIWVGTNSGIGKYPRTADDLNAWITYTSGTEIQPSAVSKEFAESLVTDQIWCITASKRHVWVGTRRGVSKIRHR